MPPTPTGTRRSSASTIRLPENFSPEEILEIVGVVVNMNVWTRIKLAEGAMPGRA